MKFNTLLAKSEDEPLLAKSDDGTESVARQKGISFTGHIAYVLQAASIITEELGEKILQQLGLESVDIGYFQNTTKLSAYCHDPGKANADFQVMVRLNSKAEKYQKNKKSFKAYWKERNHRQMLRHELISAILVYGIPELRTWLEQCPNSDLKIATWGTIGHHLKAKAPLNKIVDGTGSDLEIYVHHRDFQCFLKMGKVLGLPPAPSLAHLDQTWSKRKLKQALTDLQDEFINQEETITEDEKRLIAAVKATVITADLAGSAIPAMGYSLKQWLKQVLDLVLSSSELESLVQQRLKGQSLRPFQVKIAQTQRRVTLVKAGCGTGKTIAAYEWAKTRAIDRKLFFSYPTTGTASQGYLDYAAETQIETTLMHSRAEIDLQEILFSHEGSGEDQTEEVEAIDQRLAAFAAWQAKLIVCTVDSVLGLIQNSRKPLFSWFAISQGAFVFDEVHAYDQNLFGALLQFLRTFRGAPILLMSASFTPGQLMALEQTMSELGESLEIIEGPEKLETLPRYHLHYFSEISERGIADVDPSNSIWSSVIQALEENQKVLWVTNSVKSCIDLYKSAKVFLQNLLTSPQCLIYHSRYRYQDRLDRHKEVITGFKGDHPVLAITTQVCEMSLDLSADLLVTAMAPAPALIQRLGRLNRFVKETESGYELVSGKVCPCLIYQWENSRPYEETELITGVKLVEILQDQTVSQATLAETIAELNSTTPTLVSSKWLEGNWCSEMGFLREGGYTMTVLLEQDLADIKKEANQRHCSFLKAAQRWSIPIRIQSGYQKWKRIGFYPVAPRDCVDYSEEMGAEELYG